MNTLKELMQTRSKIAPFSRFTPALVVVHFCCCTSVAQLVILPEKAPQQVFSGAGKEVAVTWHNSGDSALEEFIRVQLFQTSSATATRWSQADYKRLQVLPGQTVPELIRMDFPPVHSPTRFLVKWLTPTNRIIGTTEVLVYPSDLLRQLGFLTEGEAFGVLDPSNCLKPLLENLKIPFEDLANRELDSFSGKFAIVGPFHSTAQAPSGIADRISTLAKKGVGVVWIQPPLSLPIKRLAPSYYCVSEDKGTVTVVQADLVADLADRPQSQINLVQIAAQTLHPEPLGLPNAYSQP